MHPILFLKHIHDLIRISEEYPATNNNLAVDYFGIIDFNCNFAQN